MCWERKNQNCILGKTIFENCLETIFQNRNIFSQIWVNQLPPLKEMMENLFQVAKKTILGESYKVQEETMNKANGKYVHKTKETLNL